MARSVYVSETDEETIDKVEDIFLQTIVTLLINGTINSSQAQSLAQEYMLLKPYKSKSDLLDKLKNYGNKHAGFSNMYHHALSAIGPVETRLIHWLKRVFGVVSV